MLDQLERVVAIRRSLHDPRQDDAVVAARDVATLLDEIERASAMRAVREAVLECRSRAATFLAARYVGATGNAPFRYVLDALRDLERAVVGNPARNLRPT